MVSGDSITKIANKFSIDPTTLADYNNIINWDTIQVGQVLQIPTDNNATPLPDFQLLALFHAGSEGPSFRSPDRPFHVF